MSVAVAVPSFGAQVTRLLEKVEYRIAESVEDREEIFRLRYQGYLRDGGIEPNETGRFSDAWDDTPNVLLIGVYLEGVLASTVRIHVSSPGLSDTPAFGPFGDVLQSYSAAGHRLIDPTRFVISEEAAQVGPYMPFLTCRLTCMAAEHFGAFGFLATVRQSHVPVYKRVTGHRAISEPRTYPLLRKPIVCMLAETAAMKDGPYRRHPVLSSTAEERRQLYGSVWSVAGHAAAAPSLATVH